MSDIVISFDWRPAIGGAHLWLYEVYKRWPRPVTILTVCPARQPEVAARQAAFDASEHGSLTVQRRALAVEKIDLKSADCWRRFLQNVRLLGTMSAGRPATLHCLRAFPEGFVGLLRKKRDRSACRLVVYAHGEEVLIARTSRLLCWIARQVYREADLVIANSESTRGLVHGLSPSARVVVIHPGVDQAFFDVSPGLAQGYRDRCRWQPGALVVSTVARMEPRKNQGALIEALGILRQEGLVLGYVCAGDGTERARLQELTRMHGLGDWVTFPGEISDEEKRLIFAASDIHAMPSIRVNEMIEGFGIVFLEAAAAGVPSIGGSVGGQPEAILHEQTGLVVDGGDLVQLCDALRRLLTRDWERRDMARKARDWAKIHDWSRVAARTVATVAEVTRDAALQESGAEWLADLVKKS